MGGGGQGVGAMNHPPPDRGELAYEHVSPCLEISQGDLGWA